MWQRSIGWIQFATPPATVHGCFFSRQHSSCLLNHQDTAQLFLIFIALWIIADTRPTPYSSDRLCILKTSVFQGVKKCLISPPIYPHRTDTPEYIVSGLVWFCNRVKPWKAITAIINVKQSQTGEAMFLQDTSYLVFLCRYSVCLGGCGETASQAEGERGSPHTGETLPAKDCPAESSLPSYTHDAANTKAAPSEGM